MALSGLGFLFFFGREGGGGAFWVWGFRICSVWGVRGVVQFLSRFVWGGGGGVIGLRTSACTHTQTHIYIYMYMHLHVSL